MTDSGGCSLDLATSTHRVWRQEIRFHLHGHDGPMISWPAESVPRVPMPFGQAFLPRTKYANRPPSGGVSVSVNEVVEENRHPPVSSKSARFVARIRSYVDRPPVAAV